MSEKGDFWLWVMLVGFSAISVAAAIADLVALESILLAFAVAVVPVDPMQTVQMKYRILSIHRYSLMLAGGGLLVVVFFALHLYSAAKSRGALFRRFAWVTLVQLLILAVGTLFR